jgi:hypothetical protein
VFVYDFVHIDRPTNIVVRALTRTDARELLAVRPLGGPRHGGIWVGRARRVRDATILPMRWSVEGRGGVVDVDGDLEITPIDARRSRAAFTGRHDRRVRLGAGDEAEHLARAAVESSVRGFLARLAACVEADLTPAVPCIEAEIRETVRS